MLDEFRVMHPSGDIAPKQARLRRLELLPFLYSVSNFRLEAVFLADHLAPIVSTQSFEN